MPDTRLQMMALAIGAQFLAEIVRGHRLADGADVVALAFDRQQHGAADRTRVDGLAVPLELAERQSVFLKNVAHRFEIELGGEVEYGEILVVERFGGRRLFMLAVGKILMELFVRLHMTL